MTQTIRANGMPRRRTPGHRKRKVIKRTENPAVRAAGFSKKHERKRLAGKRICPTHSVRLVHAHDADQLQWVCPVDGCRVRCLDGPTSTPYTPETGALRAHLHIVFDPLWKHGPRKVFNGRHGAYDWLAKQLGIDREQCHIGMFDAEACRRAMQAIEGLSK